MLSSHHRAHLVKWHHVPIVVVVAIVVDLGNGHVCGRPLDRAPVLPNTPIMVVVVVVVIRGSGRDDGQPKTITNITATTTGTAWRARNH